MFSFLQSRKLSFKFGDQPSPITLAEALAGRAGTVIMGSEGVRLWTPASGAEGQTYMEMVCDTRFEPLSEKTYEKFAEAAQGCNLTAHVVLFHGTRPEKIDMALEWFDYVLVPSFKIKNTEKDILNRVLGYEPQRPFRPREKSNF